MVLFTIFTNFLFIFLFGCAGCSSLRLGFLLVKREGATLRCSAQASLVAELGLWGTGSIVVARGVSCSMACGIFPDQELKLCLLHWQEDALPLSCQGKPRTLFSWIHFTIAIRNRSLISLSPCLRLRGLLSDLLREPYLLNRLSFLSHIFGLLFSTFITTSSFLWANKHRTGLNWWRGGEGMLTERNESVSDKGLFWVQWRRTHVPNAGGLGLIPGWGTRSHIPQLNVRMSLVKLLATTKTQRSQINIFLKVYQVRKGCSYDIIFGTRLASLP